VIKGQFEYPVGAKAIGFSDGDLSLIVEALHDPTGNQLLRPEKVANQFLVLPQGASDLLHGLDARTHGLVTPLVQELACPSGRAVIPELLECFLEKVSPDGLQVVAKEIAQAEALLDLQISLPV
jgi:hypothetical protein